MPLPPFTPFLDRLEVFIQMQLPYAPLTLLAFLTLTNAIPIFGDKSAALIASPNATLAAIPQPSCFPISTPNSALNNASNTLSDYRGDCVDAIYSFLHWPTVSTKRYQWYRMGEWAIPPLGTQNLPYKIQKKSCEVELDVLDNPEARDTFALLAWSIVIESLFRTCVRPYVDVQGSGVVAVGPKRVMEVTIKPSQSLSENLVDE